MPEASARRAAVLVLCYLPLLGSGRARRSRSGTARFAGTPATACFSSAAVAVIGLAATLVGFSAPLLRLPLPRRHARGAVAYTLVTILAIVKAIQGERLFVPGLSRYAG